MASMDQPCNRTNSRAAVRMRACSCSSVSYSSSWSCSLCVNTEQKCMLDKKKKKNYSVGVTTDLLFGSESCWEAASVSCSAEWAWYCSRWVEVDDEEDEELLSDLKSSCSLSAAQWKPRLRLWHWGIVDVGAVTTGGGREHQVITESEWIEDCLRHMIPSGWTIKTLEKMTCRQTFTQRTGASYYWGRVNSGRRFITFSFIAGHNVCLPLKKK